MRKFTGATEMAEMIEKVVRQWPQWSRAERKRIDEIVEEILDHCRNGNGNQFIRDWCFFNLPIGTVSGC